MARLFVFATKANAERGLINHLHRPGTASQRRKGGSLVTTPKNQERAAMPRCLGVITGRLTFVPKGYCEGGEVDRATRL